MYHCVYMVSCAVSSALVLVSALRVTDVKRCSTTVKIKSRLASMRNQLPAIFKYKIQFEFHNTKF